ncbi:endoplasmic reticulum-Golgi intermediate compartment protein 2-like isoform X1 [Xiphophorus couchianus]|uniref:endoplasmic reticulum-Golgi intermediate compartment protein 2-like isoform X1 n=2 Tax=Xiphophorus couchianus TaxID=32473 RepID=UPI001016CCC6|nr:endoplasmic reticulum-Golgi intermediate compartment protein 2-like isoform X1 [Xiphophorus couchianus]
MACPTHSTLLSPKTNSSGGFYNPVYMRWIWKAVLTAKMRRLSRRKALSLVKELDAFPKVADSYMETSASGGTVSIIAFSAIAVLAILEFFVYRDTWMKYDYEVDKDFSSKLRINVDVTVAMKCQHVGADILDLAETMITSNGLQYEPVIFELSPQQRLWQRTLHLLQSRLREEHAVQEVLYKTLLKGAPTALPPREDAPNEPLNGCRIHGHAYVNKVAGNLHITVGKPIHHPQGHAHIAAFVSHEAYNFSHRIDHLSFGEEVPGIINPLDGTEKITYNNNQMYQYFITVVPTKLNTHLISADTHQFSVTERERVINHAAGSHGVSGIFVKYDTSSLMVTVSEQHMALGRFLVRLCGIVGGIFSTTGMLHSLVGFCLDIVCCRFRLGAYRPRQELQLNNRNNHQTPLLVGNAPL